MKTNNKILTQRSLFVFFIVLLVVTSCSPKVSKSFQKSYAPLDYREEVLVLDLYTPIPEGADDMGKIKIGDTGFTTNCDWNTVIEMAKIEARKVGGNVIKITKHKPPSAGSSTCHRITASVLRIENTEKLALTLKNDDVAADWDYALVHFYRFGGTGALINYDIHLGNNVICRSQSKWKTSVQVYNLGNNTLWASTESKTEIPVNFEPGREYYVRCGIQMGVLVGRPTLQLVDKRTGSAEFNSIKTK